MGSVKNHRLSWQKKIEISDGYGNERGAFEEQFLRWSKIVPSLGIETTAAARLQGRQPVDITVFKDEQTAAITAAWRAVDVNTGVVYSLTSPAIDLKQNRHELTIKAVVGIGG